MRIVRVRLEGILGIYYGMNRHVLELDLRNQKNRIVLILGANRSGKSTLLQNLHPFAQPTTSGEGRKSFLNSDYTGQHLKQLEIYDDRTGDIFLIRHEYFLDGPTRSHINKNGVELNPNGGGGTFESILYNELGLTREYLKLARIGEGVRSIIDMSASDRKNFMNRILPDVDQWLKYSKTVREHWSTARSRLQLIGKMLDGLRPHDELQATLDTIKKDLNRTRRELSELSERIGAGKSEIQHTETRLNALGSEDLIQSRESLLEQLSRVEYEASELSEQIPDTTADKMQTKIARSESELEAIDRDLSRINRDQIETANSLESYRVELENTRDHDQNSSDLHDRLRDIAASAASASREATYYYEKLDPRDPIRETRFRLSNVVEFLRELYVMSVEHRNQLNGKPVYYRGDSKQITRLRTQAHRTLAHIDQTIADTRDKLNSSIAPNCRDQRCDHYQSKLDSQKHRKILEDYTTARDNWAGYLDQLEHAYTCFTMAREFKEMIASKLNYHSVEHDQLRACGLDVLTRKDIDDLKRFVWFSTLNVQYHLERLQTHDAYLANAYRYIELRDMHKNVREQLEQIETFKKDSESSHERITARYQELYERNERLKKEAHTQTQRKSKLQHTLETHRAHLETIKRLQELFEQQDELTEQIKQSQEKYDEITRLNEQLNHKRKELNTLNTEYDTIHRYHDELESKLSNVQKDIANREQYERERNETQEAFAKLTRLKNVLDPVRGIPVEITRSFLNNVEKPINQLLRVGCQDVERDLALKFNITDSEFAILMASSNEGTLNPNELPDISDGSSSEKAIGHIGLGLGMTANVLNTRYNIVCMDEIDGGFDSEYRRSFIDMIDYQLREMGCQQAFIITHNNEFDTRASDVVLLRGHGLIERSNKNVLFEWQ